MAKNKQCCWCGTRDKKEPYRRLPNGLFSCTDCLRQHSPMWAACAVHKIATADKKKMVFKTKQAEKEFDKAQKKAKEQPPLHHIEANPIIRQMFKRLMLGKRAIL